MTPTEMTVKAKRPDVVMFVRSLYNGGIDQVTVNLIEEFLARGLAVTLLVDFDNPYSPYRMRLPQGVDYVSLEARRPLARFWRLHRFLKLARPRSMVSAGYFPNVFAILTRFTSGVDMRLVVTEHNSPTVNQQLARPWEPRRWFLHFARLIYPHADAIVAVSKGVAGDLAQRIGMTPEQVRVVYNPVITRSLAERADEPVDHPWFRDPSTPVIVAVGRLEAQKNFTVLIRAIALVRRERPCRLVIFGDGSEKPMLQSVIAELGLQDAVELHGFVPNPHAFVAKAAVLANSSIWEGLSMVLVEALAVGTPVVATDCQFGTAELLCDGRHGTLVAVGDVEGLARGIAAVLREPRKPATGDWLEQFGASYSAGRYLELLAPA